MYTIQETDLQYKTIARTAAVITQINAPCRIILVYTVHHKVSHLNKNQDLYSKLELRYLQKERKLPDYYLIAYINAAMSYYTYAYSSNVTPKNLRNLHQQNSESSSERQASQRVKRRPSNQINHSNTIAITAVAKTC